MFTMHAWFGMSDKSSYFKSGLFETSCKMTTKTPVQLLAFHDLLLRKWHKLDVEHLQSLVNYILYRIQSVIKTRSGISRCLETRLQGTNFCPVNLYIYIQIRNLLIINNIVDILLVKQVTKYNPQKTKHEKARINPNHN